jgi:hypothetical protein
VTTRDGGPDPDAFWRRPDGDEPPLPEPEKSGKAAEQPGYAGPPASPQPPKGWRPPMVVQPPAPRQMPAQDLNGIEAEERSARTVTYGIGMLAGAVLLIVICLLCSRALF